jgi:cell volume regulation protein A
MEVAVVFFTVAAIMILSFLGDSVSRRILLPNVILLIVVGVICGPVLSLFDRVMLLGVVPILAPLTIAFIGFDAGLGMDLYQALAESRRAVLLSIFGFALSACVVGGFLHLIFNIRWAYAFLLASAWGGVNTATVVAVSQHLKIKAKSLTTLTMASLIDDIVVLVVALMLLNYITLGGLGVWEVSLALVRNSCVSIFVGVIAGVAWLHVLHLSRKAKYVYTFVLAAVLGIYSGTELLGGTGGIAIFIFGLILGNCRSLAQNLRLRVSVDELFAVKEFVGRFHSELTFMITTFFFVFVGLIYVWTGVFPLLLGLAVGLLLHGIRLIVVKAGTWRSELAGDFPAIGLIVGKGAASAAMSTLPLAYGLPNTELFTSVALNVILLTNIVSIVLPVLVARRTHKPVGSIE